MTLKTTMKELLNAKSRVFKLRKGIYQTNVIWAARAGTDMVDEEDSVGAEGVVPG